MNKSHKIKRLSLGVWVGSGLVAAGVVWLSFVALQPIASPLFGFGIKGHFWNQLSKEQQKGEKSISVSGLTGFEWDTLCMFYGYGDSPSKILKAHGINEIPAPHNKRADDVEKKSDVVLFAFSLNGRVVESFIESASVYMDGSEKRIKLDSECVPKETAIVRVEGDSKKQTLIFTEKRQ